MAETVVEVQTSHKQVIFLGLSRSSFRVGHFCRIIMGAEAGTQEPVFMG